MRVEFNKLKDVLLTTNIYDENTNDCIFDDVMYLMNELGNKITEVENRLTCVIETNKDSRQILKAFAYGIVDNGLDEVPIYSDQFEILQRSCNDIDIALDMNDTEPIEANWYKLFDEPKRNIHTEKPPTSLCETPQTHEFVKDIIAKLKVIDVDGETMQYILEQVGMDEQMHRQLVMKNDYKETKDLLREKFEMEL
jgi:hypothetical protein